MILKSGILLLTVLGAVQSYPFHPLPFGFNQQAPLFSPQYKLFTAPASASISAYEASPSQMNTIAQRLFYQPERQLPFPSSRYIQSPQRSLNQIHSRQQQVPNAFHMSTSQVYEPLTQQQQQQQQQPAQYSSPIVRSATPEKQATTLDSAEKDFLSSLQVIDTQGRIRDLRDFGIGGPGNDATEPELERQLLSIFHTINKDLANAQFLPLDMNGAQHQIDSMFQSQFAARDTLNKQRQATHQFSQQHQQLNQQRINSEKSFRQPAEQKVKQQQFQFLRPTREQQHQIEQQPLRSPAQTLRAADKKAPLAAVREEQKGTIAQLEGDLPLAAPVKQQLLPIEQIRAQKQVDESNRQSARQTVTSIKAPAQLLKEQELKGRHQEQNDEQQRLLDFQLNDREQEPRGQYTAPVEQQQQQRQPSIRAPADFGRKPVQVQVPIEQQQQQLGFDDESTLPKLNTQLLLPAVKEPSFTRQAQIGAKQSRIEQQQQAIERVVITGQAPIVQVTEQHKLQKQNLDLNSQQQPTEHNYGESLFAPTLTNNKQNLGWTPIVSAVQSDIINEQQREQIEPKTIINQQVIEQSRQEFQIPIDQKPVVQFKETLEEEAPIPTNPDRFQNEQVASLSQQQTQGEEQQQQKIDIKQEDNIQSEEVKPLIRQPVPSKGVRISKLKKPISKLIPLAAKLNLNSENNAVNSQTNSLPQQQQELAGKNQEGFGFEFEQQKHEEIPFQHSDLQQQKQEEALSEILAQQRQDILQQQQKQQDLENVNVQQQPQQLAQTDIDFNEQQTSSTTPSTILTTTILTTTSSSASQTAQRNEMEKDRKTRLQQNEKARQNPVQKLREQQSQLARQQQQTQTFQEQQKFIAPNSESKRPRRVQQITKQQQQQQKLDEQSGQDQFEVVGQKEAQENSRTKELATLKTPTRKLLAKVQVTRKQKQQQASTEAQQQPIVASISEQKQVDEAEQKVQQEVQQSTVGPIQAQVQTQSKQSDEFIQLKEDPPKNNLSEEQGQSNEQVNQQNPIQQNEDLAPQRDEAQTNPKESFSQQKEDSAQQLADFGTQKEDTPVQQEQQQQEINFAQEVLSRPAAKAPSQQEQFSQVVDETSTTRQDIIPTELSSFQQQEEPNQQRDNTQENRPASATQRELQQMQSQEVTTDANNQQQLSSQQPEINNTDQEQRQEQNTQQRDQDQSKEEERREGEVQIKLNDNLPENVSQERQLISTTTESLSSETEVEPTATTTIRPPTRITPPNLRREQNMFTLKQRGIGRQVNIKEARGLVSRQGGKTSRSNSQIATQKQDSDKNNSIQEGQRITNEESLLRRQNNVRVQNYVSASQLLNTYNPLQFEPERISSLKRAAESTSQTTNVNPSPSGDSY